MQETNILILGAGKSSSHLIDHLSKQAGENNWKISVADRDTSAAKAKIRTDAMISVVGLDVESDGARRSMISAHQVVISLLPAFLHDIVAEDCLELGKHFFTASYASPRLKELADKIDEKGLAFVVELGLDPGLDHMSAMADLTRIRESGGEIISFQSHAGGLIAPESDTNPWHYKFTWNPYNVIRAGFAGALYLSGGQQRLIPYHKLFSSSYEVDFPGLGKLEGYPNRDSLKYRSLYGLDDAQTVLRGTLRMPGFCAAWQELIDLGLTSDEVELDCTRMSKSTFFGVGDPQMKLNPANYNGEVWKKLKWLGAADNTDLGIHGKHSPASALEILLKNKWYLEPDDRDMVLMLHDIVYLKSAEVRRSKCWLTCKGQNAADTAMSRLVGMPLAVGVETFLSREQEFRGLVYPTDKAIFKPVLSRLAELGISFEHEDLVSG